MISIRATTDFVRFYGYGHTYGDTYTEISNAPFINRVDGEFKDAFIMVSLKKYEEDDFDRLYKDQVNSFYK